MKVYSNVLYDIDTFLMEFKFITMHLKILADYFDLEDRSYLTWDELQGVYG